MKKQQQMDVMLEKEVDGLVAIKGGLEDGSSWKSQLRDDCPWPEVVAAAKTAPFPGAEGKAAADHAQEGHAGVPHVVTVVFPE